MAKWDDVVKGVEGKGEDERKKAFNQYRAKCVCPTCPTYTECTKKRGELAFCLMGKSGCELTQKVCYCPSCPVHDQLKLQFMYYCIRGDEGAQRK